MKQWHTLYIPLYSYRPENKQPIIQPNDILIIERQYVIYNGARTQASTICKYVI